MNIIAIDPSLISTAVCVNDVMFNYCRYTDAHGKNGTLSKWYDKLEKIVNFKYVEYDNFDNYSDGEIIKLRNYNKITDDIVSDILNNIDLNDETKMVTEGYSFASNPTSIIDLVSFSTLLRNKIFERVTEDILVLSPSTLKLESCKLTYKPINIGKKTEKLVYQNNDGIKGGSFTKREMVISMMDNDKIQTPFAIHCRSIRDELLATTKISKPYDDICDSQMLSEIVKAKY
jgi:hypothetical protein